MHPSVRPASTSARERLAFLAPNLLFLVTNPLAFVRLGGPVGADLGCSLPNLLAIDAADDNLGRFGHRNGDAFRHGVETGTETDGEILDVGRLRQANAGERDKERA